MEDKHIHIIKLNPRLLEVNARIPASSAILSGTVHNGYNKVYARIAPGTAGTIELSFKIVVSSITSLTFDFYRTELRKILKEATENTIAQAAGIRATPPPVPSSRMAGYARQLLSDVVFDGQAVCSQSRPFNAQDCTSSECQHVLRVTRSLSPAWVSLSGTLKASSESVATRQVAAYVPVTAIEFSDKLTITFAGYSDNVLVDDNGLKRFEIPGEFWSELAGGRK